MDGGSGSAVALSVLHLHHEEGRGGAIYIYYTCRKAKGEYTQYSIFITALQPPMIISHTCIMKV